MSGLDDEELARRSGAGDEAAFRELLGRYDRRLYGFLRLRAGQEADDIFQEVCVKVWTGLKSYEARGRFPAWLFSVARNAALDHLDKERRRPSTPAGDPAQPAEERLAERGPGPDRLAETDEAAGRIRRALAALPAEQREVFLLRDYGGLTFREIAGVQGCPLGTALARMQYALAKLRDQLGEDAA